MGRKHKSGKHKEGKCKVGGRIDLVFIYLIFIFV